MKIDAVDADASPKLVDWYNVSKARIMGYSEYNFLKGNAPIQDFREGSARWRYFNQLLGMDRLIKEF